VRLVSGGLGLLAHQGGADEGLSTVLFLGAGLLAWIGAARLRGTGFPRVPKAMAWGAAGMAPVVLAAAFILPARLFPGPSAIRPSTSAKVSIVRPAEGAVFPVGPAEVTVQVKLQGGKLTSTTSTRLIPNEGHLHVYLDGALISMTQGLTQRLEVWPGAHVVRVDFVATDHGLFNPPVTAEVDFSVQGA
jgi:hypothetical protein